MAQQVSEQDWGDLLTSIELNECVLILGPNIAMPATGNAPAEPLTRQFARQLAKLLPADKISDVTNLSHVTEVYIREINNLTRFKGQLQAFYNRDYVPPPALEHLSYLPFRLIINAAPDDLMCKAYLKRHVHYNSTLYNFDQSGAQEEPNYDSRDETPFIYHLFGNHAVPGSVVLTESQQIEFVQQIIQKEHKIPNSILAELRESKNYLLLGFDFSDWYLRLLLSALNPKEEAKIPVSFALQSGFATLPPTAENFFWRRFKIGFFNEDLEAFTGELRRRWEQKGQAPTPQPIAAGNTNALLLYADADTAWQKAFIEHAGALPREHRLQFGEVAPGENVADKLSELMKSATVVIPLITAAFLNQYYDLWEQQLLPLYRAGTLTVVPVLTEDTLWDSLPGIDTMPILPRTKIPIGNWDNKPEAWQHVMTEISTILQNL